MNPKSLNAVLTKQYTGMEGPFGSPSRLLEDDRGAVNSRSECRENG